MMRKTLPTLLVAAFAVGLAGSAHALAVHFALTKSVPEAESTVDAPEEIRLWFSQVPQDGSVAIRLLDGGGELVETSDPISDESDGKIVYVTVDGTLGAGAYTVAWRGIGDDGHVVRGDFPFSVAAR